MSITNWRWMNNLPQACMGRPKWPKYRRMHNNGRVPWVRGAHTIIITIIIVIITKPKPAYGWQSLVSGIVGPRYISSRYLLGCSQHEKPIWNCEKPCKLGYGWSRVIMGGYGWLRWLQETPRKRWWFFMTHRQALHHNIYIYIIARCSTTGT